MRYLFCVACEAQTVGNSVYFMEINSSPLLRRFRFISHFASYLFSFLRKQECTILQQWVLPNVTTSDLHFKPQPQYKNFNITSPKRVFNCKKLSSYQTVVPKYLTTPLLFTLAISK